MALMLPRLGPTIVLSAAYVLTITTSISLCTFQSLDGFFLIALALVGAFAGGSQFCLNAVVNQFYPTGMRATASGYATGMGRLGAIVAPAVGVAFMSTPQLAPAAFAAPAGAACLALAALLFLQAQTRYSQTMEATGA
jgi:AAHS family 4-hydroxybenzoate transporter-like MFS transporter